MRRKHEEVVEVEEEEEGRASERPGLRNVGTYSPTGAYTQRLEMLEMIE